jgi:hypothetical protein
MPDLPQAPEFAVVNWHKVAADYCLDEENKRALLWNDVVLTGYTKDLMEIIKGKKETKP